MGPREFKGIWPFRNMGLKILALVLAFTLWVAVKSGETIQSLVPISLIVAGYPDTLVIVNKNSIPEKVEVLLEGPRVELFKASFPPNKVMLTAEKSSLGTKNYTISQEYVKLASLFDVRVLNFFTPREIILIFDRRDSVILPIEPVIGEMPLKEYAIYGRIISIPESVTVIGPKKQLASTRRVPTASINLKEVKTLFSDSVRLEIVDCPVCVLKPSKIAVTIPIVVVESRLFSDLPVNIADVKGKFNLQPKYADLTLSGPEPLIDSIPPESITLYVKPLEWLPGQYSLKPEINLPSERLQIVSLEPLEFLLEIPPDSLPASE